MYLPARVRRRRLLKASYVPPELVTGRSMLMPFCVPVCGSLADGHERYPRQGDDCECHEGWSGINCNGESASQRRIEDRV